MIVCKTKKSSVTKWIVASIIFVSALCITFADVYGMIAF